MVNKNENLTTVNEPQLTNKEDSKAQTLLKSIYTHMSLLVNNVELTLPKVTHGENGPTYRRREHTIFLKTTEADQNPDVLAVLEEVFHSIVAQIPGRITAYQKMDTFDHELNSLPTSVTRTERMSKRIQSYRNQVAYYNTEEFLARYSVYHFLSNTELNHYVTKLYGVSSEALVQTLQDALGLGLRMRANYEEGFSQAWYHTWGYLYASSLFLTEGKPTPESLFDNSDETIWKEADEFLTTLRLKNNPLRDFFTEEQLGITMERIDRFKGFLYIYLNPQTPELFTIARQPKYLTENVV